MVVAALAMIDDGGLESFSLRRLAAAMGVGNMTLYGHVESRDALLALVYDHVLGTVESDDLDQVPPFDAIRVLAGRWQQAMRPHPHLFPLHLSDAVLFGPNAARIVGHYFDCFARAGLDAAQALEAFNLTVAVQLGTAVVDRIGVDTGLRAELRSAAAAFEGGEEAAQLEAAAAAPPLLTVDERLDGALRALFDGLPAILGR